MKKSCPYREKCLFYHPKVSFWILSFFSFNDVYLVLHRRIIWRIICFFFTVTFKRFYVFVKVLQLEVIAAWQQFKIEIGLFSFRIIRGRHFPLWIRSNPRFQVFIRNYVTSQEMHKSKHLNLLAAVKIKMVEFQLLS